MSTRTLIRGAVISALAGLPTSGARVFDSPTSALTETQMPALVISLGEQEPSAPWLASGIASQRELTVLVTLLVKQSTGWQATLDTMLDEVLAALYASLASRTLGGLVQPMVEGTTSEPDVDASTDQPVASLRYVQRVIFAV